MRFEAVNYDAASKTWTDSSGNGRSITSGSVRGSPVVVTSPAGTASSSKSFPVVQGGTGDGIQLGNAALAHDAYTWFSIARYSGAAKGRIFDGLGVNYLTGFIDVRSGIAYHGNSISYNPGDWLTPILTDMNGDNWFVWMDQAARIRNNGIDIQSTTTNTNSFPPMTINYGWHVMNMGEASDWQVAEIILFDVKLDLPEIQPVESNLGLKYGISGYT